MDKDKLIKILAAIVILFEAANLFYVYFTEERIAWFSLIILIVIVACLPYYLNSDRGKNDREKE